MNTTIRGFVPPETQDPIPVRLGWAVIQLWKELPDYIRAQLREQAGLVEVGPKSVQHDQQLNDFVAKYAGKL